MLVHMLYTTTEVAMSSHNVGNTERFRVVFNWHLLYAETAKEAIAIVNNGMYINKDEAFKSLALTGKVTLDDGYVTASICDTMFNTMPGNI